MLLLEVNEPTITDWIQSIGVILGIPITIWGVFQLFIKDKEKELQITYLKELASSQNEMVTNLKSQVDQLILQTGEFKYQSSLMLDSNEILRGQFELQNNMFKHSKEEGELRLKIDKLRRSSEIRPFFVPGTYFNYSSSNFGISLKNKGGIAQKISLDTKEFPFKLASNPKLSDRVAKNGEVIMNFDRIFQNNENKYSPIANNVIQMRIHFEDEDNEEYFQIIKILYFDGITLDPPISKKQN